MTWREICPSTGGSWRTGWILGEQYRHDELIHKKTIQNKPMKHVTNKGSMIPAPNMLVHSHSYLRHRHQDSSLFLVCLSDSKDAVLSPEAFEPAPTPWRNVISRRRCQPPCEVEGCRRKASRMKLKPSEIRETQVLCVFLGGVWFDFGMYTTLCVQF